MTPETLAGIRERVRFYNSVFTGKGGDSVDRIHRDREKLLNKVDRLLARSDTSPDVERFREALREVSDSYPMAPPCRSCMHAACIARRALSGGST